MPTHDASAAGVADSPLEIAQHGSHTMATALPLLISPALAKFATGVEAVIKSQSTLAFQLERLNAEILRLDSVPSVPAQLDSTPLHSTYPAAQIDAAEKLKRCRKMIERTLKFCSVSKLTKNIKTRIGAINGYKATIMQHMPELQAVGSGVSAPAPCSETPAPPVIQQPAGVSAIAGSGLTEAQAIAGNDGALHESEDLECKLKACGGEAE